jgi:hypothetical protein
VFINGSLRSLDGGILLLFFFIGKHLTILFAGLANSSDFANLCE